MRTHYHTLDVFTDRLFGGNPLAVFPDATPIPDRLLGPIARELNLSETVFVYPPETPLGTRRVRIFTPGGEVPFAGHPTVGTAFLLAATGAVASEPGPVLHIVLEELVGPVAVEVAMRHGRPVSARLTAAVLPPEVPVSASAEELARMLSLEPGDIGSAGLGGAGATGALEPSFASAGLPFLIVPVASVAAAGRARLDVAARAQALGANPPNTFVYVVTPGGAPGVDLHTRMFAPEIGVPEDPATGSAAAALGSYLGRRLTQGDGEAAWRVEQGVEMGRPSILDVDVRVEGGVPTRVRVAGRCVMVARGEMEIPDSM